MLDGETPAWHTHLVEGKLDPELLAITGSFARRGQLVFELEIHARETSKRNISKVCPQPMSRSYSHHHPPLERL